MCPFFAARGAGRLSRFLAGRPQGALVGLAAGLAMAFWIGIGSFVARMPASTVTPPPFENVTATVMTALVNATTPKPR